jgi:transposase-like protein
MEQQETMSFLQFAKKFGGEDACRAHLFGIRWPEGFICPKCGGRHYYEITTRNKYECASCHYQASVTAGTVMDKTHIPLAKWFWAIELAGMDKRGHSALSISKELEIGCPAAWHMLQRIRTAMMEKDWSCKLFGVVEMDECFVGAAAGAEKGAGEPTRPRC